MTKLQNTQIGPYHLQQMIGSGGMADVHRAEQRGPHGFSRQVALKVIHTDKSADAAFRQMFVEEAQVVQGLSHGNIVPLFDFGEDQGEIYIAMELAETSLIRLLAQVGGPLEPGLALYITLCVARALDHAHTRRDAAGRPLGIIHRDVSPHNVLLTADGQVKLTDFGIARFAGRSTCTSPGHVVGKIGYLAPEQVTDAPLDHRTDIFGLGLVTYEMLAGANPQKGEHLGVSLRRTVEADVPPLEGCPAEIAAVVMKMVQRRPEDRYTSAAQVVAALERHRASTGDLTGAHELAALLRQVGLVAAARPSLNSALEEVLGSDEETNTHRQTVVERPRAPGNRPLSRTARRPGRWVLLALTALLLLGGAGVFWARWAGCGSEPGCLRVASGVAAGSADLEAGPPRSEEAGASPERDGRVNGQVDGQARPRLDRPHFDRPSDAPGSAPDRRTQRPRDQRVWRGPDQGLGALWINLMPWARVTLDGKAAGDTPFQRQLAAGVHRLLLENPHLKLRRELRIEIKPGETQRIENW